MEGMPNRYPLAMPRLKRAEPRAAFPAGENARNVLEATAGKRALNCGIENVGGDRRDKAPGEARGQQRKGEDVASGRAFARCGEPLTANSERTVNDERGPQDQQ